VSGGARKDHKMKCLWCDKRETLHLDRLCAECERDFAELRRLLNLLFSDRRLNGRSAVRKTPIEEHENYCFEHTGHLRNSPACDLARERDLAKWRAEASGE